MKKPVKIKKLRKNKRVFFNIETRGDVSEKKDF